MKFTMPSAKDCLAAARQAAISSPFSKGLVFSPDTAVFPGFCDVHVHFREPGFSYKETIRTGSLAAARGGYTAVCTMPNLSPVPDCREALDAQLSLIRRDAVVGVYPVGAITKGELGKELAAMEELAEDCVGFSDDGRGVQDEATMRAAMERARRLSRPIVAHCEVNALLNGGYIHAGEYAARHGHRGICSESEYAEVERDLYLAEKTGCALHLCHISTAESVSLIRAAKARGVDVTAETAPHYLILTELDLMEDGRFKMNPPLRGVRDREALLEGILDGTLDMIATDHAPHSAEEKSRGLAGSAFGIVGLETAFSSLYTHLLKEKLLTEERLCEVMALAPRARFSLPLSNDFTVFDTAAAYTVDPEEFLSLGRATPFAGARLYGVCRLTVANGKTVYKNY